MTLCSLVYTLILVQFKISKKFQWDAGNRGKNFTKHQVTDAECEEVFFDSDKKLLIDTQHSASEPRYILIGQTYISDKVLFVVFIIRHDSVRVISARPLNKKERKLYDQ